MDTLLWITIGFIVIGFVVIVSLKKNMENKLAFIKENMESEEVPRYTKIIILWILGITVWGIVSIVLIIWNFDNHYG